MVLFRAGEKALSDVFLPITLRRRKNLQEMHFKTTESGATAHICTDKTGAVTDGKARRGEYGDLKAVEKDGWKLKEKLYIYIWIIIAIFAYK